MPDLQRQPDISLIPTSKRKLLTQVSVLAGEAGMLLYLAGGVVRDLLLGQRIQDLDVVIEGDAIKLARLLVRRGGGKLTTHPKFGTATWELPTDGGEAAHESLDLATARIERYEYPGALPEVEFSSIREDLSRRDFTINAMALRLEEGRPGVLLDPFEGRHDLDKGLLRALHPGSFMDDPTRMFRLVRYGRRFEFKIAPETRRLVNALACEVLSSLSGERLRHELDLILDEPAAAAMLADAQELGLLRSLHPSLHKPSEDFASLRDSAPDPHLGITAERRSLGYLLWLMDLSPADLSVLSRRLDFTAGLTKFLTAASLLRLDLESLREAPPSRWTPRLDSVPPLAIYAVYLRTEEPALATYLVRWRHVNSTINGEGLKKRGLVPGPFFKKTLLRLRAAWLDGEVHNSKEENALLEKILKEQETA